MLVRAAAELYKRLGLRRQGVHRFLRPTPGITRALLP